MTEERWTPGPWVVFGRREVYPGIESISKAATIVVFGEHERDECGVRGDKSYERLPNAHLIAAAPELYGALNAIYQNPNCRKEVEAQIGEEVWMPLAKARGENSR